MMRQWKTLKLADQLIWVCTFLSIVLFGFFSYYDYFSDSEIWLITISQKVFHPANIYSIYYKWPFHLLTYLITWPASSDIDVYHLARTGWFLLALTSLLLTVLVFAKLFFKTPVALTTFTLTLCSTLFFSQSFKIRADSVSYLIHVLLLFLFIRIRQWSILYMAIFSCLVLLMLLSTPKAIYFYLLQLLLSLLLKKSNFINTTYKKIIAVHILPFLFLTIIFIFISLFKDTQFLARAASSALDFYLKSFEPQSGTPPLASMEGFYYFIDFFKKNPIFLLSTYFWFFYLILKIIKWRNFASNSLFPIHIYCLFLFVAVLLHNQKLPFFLAYYLLPLLVFTLGFWLNFIYNKSARLYYVMSFCATFASISLIAQYAYKHLAVYSNPLQLSVIEQIQNYQKKYPEVKIYDVIGLLPRQNKIYSFIGISEIYQKESIFKQVTKEKPDVVLYVKKMELFEPLAQNYLKKHMIHFDEGVWLSGKEISPIKTPELFKHPRKIKDQDYWVLPSMKEKIAYDLISKTAITDQIMNLDETHIGLPKKYLFVVFTMAPRLELLASPFDTFKFDREVLP